jgi:hypothetical protein
MYEPKIYSLKKNSFTRNRKMTFEDLINYIIVNNGRTSTLELDEFMEEKYKDEMIFMRKQSISDKRMLLNPMIFKDMNNDCLKDVYYLNKDYLETYKGYYLCAGDGSIFEIPNHKMTRKEFEINENTLNYTNPSRARASGLYDILNGYIIDSNLDTIHTGELPLMLNNIKNSSKILPSSQTISIFDRGYPSIELFLTIMEQNGKFICRLKTTSYKKEQESITSDDECVKINLNKNRTNKIKDPELKAKAEKKTHLKLRIVKIQLENGTTEILITNLPKKLANKNELKKLYNLRWGIETDYDVLKNKLHIENFSGLRKTIIEQDFYSQIFMHNILNEHKLKVNYDNKEKNKKQEITKEYQPNINILAGKLKSRLYKIIFSKDIKEQERIMQRILKLAEDNMILVKKKKSTPRKPYTNNKFPPNIRKNF